MFKDYLKTLLLLVTSSGVTVLAFNFLVDPLWYSDGNRFSRKNFIFDERVSKTNLFLQTLEEKKYNCIIFGSSRATLLRHSLFENHTCFNYAFSGGKIEEFLAYANFVRDQGVEPDVVYVGIDSFNFEQVVDKSSAVPIEPMPFYRAYLSLGVLQFSIKTLLSDDIGNRYYDGQAEFESKTSDRLPPYQPRFLNGKASGRCDLTKVSQYQKIQEVFPQAKVVGFVAPISAWHVINTIYDSDEMMTCYLEGVYDIAKSYDVVYDFSLPSSVTRNPQNSYDPDHYYPVIQDQVARVIQGLPSTLPQDFGVVVGDLSLDQYMALYLSRIRLFLIDEGQEYCWRDRFDDSQSPVPLFR